MVYDLDNEYQRIEFSHKVKELWENRKLVELTQKFPKRTNSQNRKVTSQCGLYHPTTLLPIMVTILCFLTPMSIHLSSNYLILCRNVKLSHKT